MSTRENTNILIDFLNNSSESLYNQCLNATASEIEDLLRSCCTVKHPLDNTEMFILPDCTDLDYVDWDQVAESFECCTHCENQKDDCTCDVCSDCDEVVHDCNCEKCECCDETESNCECEKCKECDEVKETDCSCDRCEDCTELVSECDCKE